jgi:uncharacterized protein YacL (UPF0231 family)
MTRFYLNEQNKLKTAIEAVTRAVLKFNARDFDADQTLLLALNETAAIYKELGKTDRENECQTLKAEWITAQRGINPISFEKITSRRGEMLSTISFKVMQRVGHLLNLDVEEVDAKLNEVSALISQVIVAAFQGGLLTEQIVRDAKTQEEKERLWVSLGADANIAIGQKRVLLQVNRFDVLIVFDELLQRLIE